MAHGAGRGHDASVHGGGRSRAWRSAASPRCATSFPTWKPAASGPTRRRRAGGSARCRCDCRAAAAGVPLFAGGKSFGGRMTSQAQAEAPLPDVRGLVFLGFPLHPAERRPTAAPRICTACVFRCCSCKARAMPWRSRHCWRRWSGAWAIPPRCSLVEHGDHSFHMPKRATRNDAQVLAGLCDTITAWIAAIPRPAAPPAGTAPP